MFRCLWVLCICIFCTHVMRIFFAKKKCEKYMGFYSKKNSSYSMTFPIAVQNIHDNKLQILVQVYLLQCNNDNKTWFKLTKAIFWYCSVKVWFINTTRILQYLQTLLTNTTNKHHLQTLLTNTSMMKPAAK